MRWNSDSRTGLMAAKGPTRRRSSVAMLYMVRGIGPTTELDLAKFPVPRPPLLISSGKWVIVLDRLVRSVIGLPNNCIKAGQRSCLKYKTFQKSIRADTVAQPLCQIRKTETRRKALSRCRWKVEKYEYSPFESGEHYSLWKWTNVHRIDIMNEIP